MATLNNSRAQHPADGQHTPGGRCTGAIFFQNIQKEKKNPRVLMFLNHKDNYLTKCSFCFLPGPLWLSQLGCLVSSEHLSLVRKRNHYSSYRCLQTFWLFTLSTTVWDEFWRSHRELVARRRTHTLLKTFTNQFVNGFCFLVVQPHIQAVITLLIIQMKQKQYYCDISKLYR